MTAKEKGKETVPLSRYRLTLKSLRSKIDGFKNAASASEREWHIGLALKIIREELYLYKPKSNKN